jgi:DNA helicase-2/ATP-dependent DNA helicase PcrA
VEETDPLTAQLDESQRRAVTFSEDRPLCVLAGPGSGKTRVLTRRIAYRCANGTASPDHTVAVTFTRKAALELRHRLMALGLHDGVTTGTFHSLAFAELKRRWRDQGTNNPSLLTRTTRAVADLLPQETPLAEIRRVSEELAWASSLDLDAAGYAAEAQQQRRPAPVAGATMAELIVAYAAWKKQRNVIDFDDLLRLFTIELRSDLDYQAAVHWRHRHFHVDEFQDLNPLQFSLLTAWSGSDLFAVGDPNQAIFGWNGADSGYLDQFGRHFPEAEIIRLEYSYRSTPEILSDSYAVLDPSGATVRPQCLRPQGDPPTIRSHADESEEGAALARNIRDHRGPTGAWSSQAVLVRTRDQIGTIAEALRRAGIPHLVRDEVGFANLPEITDALDTMYRADRSLAVEIADLRAETGAGTSGDPNIENLRTLCELGLDHLRLDPEASARAFVSWARATYRNQGIDLAGDAVDILTFHAAKGLEWNAVHIAGAERGLVPIHHATTAAEHAEERRLLFVAMTRAQRQLHISWARTREFNGEVYERSRSPLLAALIETESESQAVTGQLGRPRGLDEARDALQSALRANPG